MFAGFGGAEIADTVDYSIFDGFGKDIADYHRPIITLSSDYRLAFLPAAAAAAIDAVDACGGATVGAGAERMRDGPKKEEQSDDFLMYTYKVKSCTKKKSHDWTACPYAHRGEKARRRDPRKFPYSAVACPEFRQRGGCGRGQACEYAHGVFEFWLHPARYRTKMCDAGPACPRKICFFAHAPEQLRPETVRYCLRCGGGFCLGYSSDAGEVSEAAAGPCPTNSSEEIESSEAACGGAAAAPPPPPPAAASAAAAFAASAAAPSPPPPHHHRQHHRHHYASSADAKGEGDYFSSSSSASSSPSAAAAGGGKGDGNGFACVGNGDDKEEDYSDFPHLDWILNIVK